MNAAGIVAGIVIAFFGLMELLFGGFGSAGLAGVSGASLVPYSLTLAVLAGIVTIVAGALVAWRL